MSQLLEFYFAAFSTFDAWLILEVAAIHWGMSVLLLYEKLFYLGIFNLDCWT